MNHLRAIVFIGALVVVIAGIKAHVGDTRDMTSSIKTAFSIDCGSFGFRPRGAAECYKCSKQNIPA